MNASFDKVILIRDEDRTVRGIVVHDTQVHKKVFYAVSEMDMEAIMDVLNHGKSHIRREVTKSNLQVIDDDEE